MKKTLTIFVIGIMLLAIFAGCSNPDQKPAGNDAGNPPPATGGGGEVKNPDGDKPADGDAKMDETKPVDEKPMGEAKMDETKDGDKSSDKDEEKKDGDKPADKKEEMKPEDKKEEAKTDDTKEGEKTGGLMFSITTEKGVMKGIFYPEDAPNTVLNFVTLAKKGFYDGLTFHRVVPNFVIQGGDPSGNGTGGPGYAIRCETTGGHQIHKRGALSMAHAGKDTGGSQFFICHTDETTSHLNGKHTVFGQVTEGLDVIEEISEGDKMLKVEITGDMPEVLKGRKLETLPAR